MRRATLLGLGLLLAAFAAFPAGSAASEFVVSDIVVLDHKGTELELLPVGGRVQVVAFVKNTGNSTYEGAVNVKFLIESAQLTTPVEQSVGATAEIPAGKTTEVAFHWSPPVKGDYSVRADLVGVTGTPLRATFQVVDTAVPEGDLPQRLMDYWWLFGGFAADVVLFLGVLRLRPV